MIYLDNAATTKIDEDVLKEMCNVMTDNFGNPSSMHTLGLNAYKELRDARDYFSSLLFGYDIVFTSGGSESNNSIIRGVCKYRTSKHIITSMGEHPSVLEVFKELEKEGYNVTYLPLLESGRVDLAFLKKSICKDTFFVSIMNVNNETGVINDISEISKILKAESKKYNSKIIFHSDMIQSFSKFNIKTLPDIISISGHKFNAPRGIGMIAYNKSLILHPLMLGGGQENSIRPGTENLPAIVAMKLASQKAFKNLEINLRKVKELKEYLIGSLRRDFSDVKIYGDDSVSPYILNFSLGGLRGEVLLHYLETRNIFVSTGSACSSKKKGSHVLKAMGFPKDESIRVSFSKDNTIEDIDNLLDALRIASKDLVV